MKYNGKEYKVERNAEGVIVAISEAKHDEKFQYAAAPFALATGVALLLNQFTSIEDRLNGTMRKAARGFFGVVCPVMVIVMVILAATVKKHEPVDAVTFQILKDTPEFKSA